MSRNTTTVNVLPNAYDELPPPERRDIDHQILNEDRGGVRVHADQPFECLSCNAKIAGEMKIGYLMPFKAFDMPKRVFRAYCEHCKLLIEVETKLSGGIWEAANHGTVIRDPKAIRRHLDAVRASLTPHRQAS